jgi:hypothetical protein
MSGVPHSVNLRAHQMLLRLGKHQSWMIHLRDARLRA